MNNNYWKEYFKNSSKLESSQQQVGRTLNKKDVSKKQFSYILKDVEIKLDIKPTDVVLDLCCGNGLFTTYLSEKCKFITGVDFTKEFIDILNKNNKGKNIRGILSDITTVQFPPGSFDKILLYFSIQHLSNQQTIKLFKNSCKWLKPGGKFFIGDIPDAGRIWDFFNTKERERYYFDSIEKDAPIIGTWYSRDFLKKLGHHSKFKNVTILDQPGNFPYSHYRFNMILTK